MSKPSIPETLRAVAGQVGLGAIAIVAATSAHAEPPAAQGADAKVLDSLHVTTDRPLANPYADPAAPYKVDKSANGKFTEDLLNTPKTITAIPKEVIRDLGATTVKDVMRTQPGITMGTGEGGNAFGDRFFIRGFDARNDMYIDGMRDPGVGTREIFDVEQIEIVKGPGSTFAGRGSTGGAVNMVSKAAQPMNGANLEFTYGTDNTKRVTADINRVVTKKLSLRLNGMWHDADVAERDAVFQKRWGAAVAAAYQLTDDITIKADYYHIHINDLPDWGMPFDSRTQRPFNLGPRDAFYGLVDRDFFKAEADVATGSLEWELSDQLRFTTRLRWGESSNRYVVSAPEQPVLSSPNPALWTVRSNPKNRNNDNMYYVSQSDLTYEFATGYVTHTLVAGVEYSHERIFNRPYAINAESNTLLPATAIVQPILSPNPYQAVDAVAVPSGNFANVNVDTKAVYVLDTVKFNKHWEMFGGIRYDSYRIERYSELPVVELHNDADLVNWFGGIVYKPVAEGTIYASAGSSSNPSGEQVDSNGDAYGGLTANSASLDPERNRSYEVGAKWNLFDRHLNVAGALFRTIKSNARVAGPGVATLFLDGKLMVQGVEGSVGGNITPRWSAFGGLTVLESKVVESRAPADVGKRFPNVSAITFSLLSTYQVTGRLTVGGQAYYASAKHGGRTAVLSSTIPDYWRFDMNAAFQISPHLVFRINALNLTNKLYYDAIYASATPFAYVAPGRSVRFSIAGSF